MNHKPNQSPSKSVNRLWNRNFRLLSTATIMGAAGGLAAEYGLSFLVFSETESTLATAFSLFIQIIPMFFIPLIVGPILDRFSRKTILVFGDTGNATVYLCMGIFLLKAEFSYPVYLFFSLILAICSALDELAFDSILPQCISPGMEQKSYAITSLIYPTLQVIMMPLAAFLIGSIGLSWVLIGQSALSLAAAITESRIRIHKVGQKLEPKADELEEKTGMSFSDWKEDQKAALRYLKKEPGILAMQVYSVLSNSVSRACYPILIAFFSVTAGFSPMLYPWFTVFECLGRMAGSLGLLRKDINNSRKYPISMAVFTIYDIMDGILLFLSFPWMLANRALCGFLGNTSYTIRTAALQSYIPDEIRGRVNSFQSILFFFMQGSLTIVFGFLGDHLEPRLVMAIGSLLTLTVLALTWGKQKKACQRIFLYKPQAECVPSPDGTA